MLRSIMSEPDFSHGRGENAEGCLANRKKRLPLWFAIWRNMQASGFYNMWQHAFLQGNLRLCGKNMGVVWHRSPGFRFTPSWLRPPWIMEVSIMQEQSSTVARIRLR